MHDDLFESDSYFNPEFRAEQEAEPDAPPAELPTPRLKLLQRIAADTSHSFSIRADAQRLIELSGNLRQSDWAQRYNDIKTQANARD